MKIRVLGFALLCGAACSVHADADHDRIAGERAAVDAKLAEQERDCATRFVVATCVEEARTEHRQALKHLRQQELARDEGRRHAIAEARRQAIADKAQAQQARASDPVHDAPRVRVRRAPAPAERAERAEDGPATPSPAAAASSAGRGEIGQGDQEKFEARRRNAQAHRDAVERRNAQRAATGKVAAPLSPVGGPSPR